jgi:hypothetical protein
MRPMIETDDSSIIPRARAYGNDRWREVRGLPAAPAAVEADLTNAQRKSFRCLVGIIDTPLTGNEQSDFLLRRNQVEACRVILQLKPTPLPTTFPMPRLESVADAVSAHAAIIEAVSGGKLAPLEGAEISRAVEGWVRALKATKLRPFSKKEPAK